MNRPAITLLLGLGLFSAGLPAQPTFRADPAHSGVYEGAGVPVLHGVKWKFRAGGAIVSSPALSDGTLFFGCSDHNVYAIDQRTGALRWKFATRGRVTSSPTVAAGTVYIGSFDGNFYALDAKTGKQRWQFATEGERRFSARHLHGAEPAAEVMPDPFDIFLSSPVVSDQTVYFGSGDGNVYALHADSGALRWKFHTGNVVHASPALADGTVYVGSWDSFFYALDAASGQERWRFKTGEDARIGNQVGIQSSAVMADGTVYFGCRDSHLYALDAKTGARRWAFDNKGSWVISSPSVRDGILYFATSDSAMVRALDARTGVLRFELSFNHWPFFSSPALAGDYLYIGSHAGKLIAVDVKTKKLAWSFVTDGASSNAAALTSADGSPNYRAAITDSFYDSLVIGVDRMMSVGAVLSSALVEGDTLYFGSWDGQLYALG